ncbi:MAG TPA: DUF3592 domain-containing protein [Candidatus Ozemobacteraceae bacterium]|nr:DUF3592 domain-containing protein [Candidatus Ozemobacteraceae bacterium]
MSAPQTPAPPVPGLTGLSAFTMLVFGFIFTLIGGYVFSLSWEGWITYFRAGNWRSVSARVESAKLAVHSNGTRAKFYSLHTVYHYTWQGQDMVASRSLPTYGPSGMSGSGEFYREKLNYLNVQMQASQPVDILVNPDNPTESLLIREVCPGMFFSIIFGGIMFTFGFFGLLGLLFPSLRLL